MTLRLKKQNGQWYVDGTVAGIRIRQSTKLPATPQYKALAERERLKLESDAIHGSLGGNRINVTFREACDDYIKWKRVEGKSTSRAEISLDKVCETLGSVKLPDLSTQTLQVFAAGAWPGCKPGTVKRNMGVVRAVLNYAAKVNQGYTAPHVEMPKVNDARDIHFDEGQATAFLNWVRDEYPMFDVHFTTLIDTGVRLNEMLTIRSTSFGDDVVRIRKRVALSGKTVSRDIPLTPDMLRVRGLCVNKKATEPLFLSLTGGALNAMLATKTLNKILKEGCKALGLPHEGEAAMRVHDLRHTFAYLTAKAGADIGDLQYLLGHEDISQTMRYRGFIQSRARTFVSSMRCA